MLYFQTVSISYGKDLKCSVRFCKRKQRNLYNNKVDTHAYDPHNNGETGDRILVSHKIPFLSRNTLKNLEPVEEFAIHRGSVLQCQLVLHVRDIREFSLVAFR